MDKIMVYPIAYKLGTLRSCQVSFFAQKLADGNPDEGLDCRAGRASRSPTDTGRAG